VSLDAVAVLPLSISEFDCFSLGATPVSYDAVASECAWLAWYCLSEESALYLCYGSSIRVACLQYFTSLWSLAYATWV
jgi:hypothetical protein